jgi:hypothetical protein
MYKEYFINYAPFIRNKWKNEKIKDYNLLKTTTIENVILNESYKFTEVDIILMNFYYQLPIVFLKQGTGKIKILRRDNQKTEYSYYIKIIDKYIFMLFCYHKNPRTFKIYESDLKEEYKKNLLDYTMELQDYLRNDEFIIAYE